MPREQNEFLETQLHALEQAHKNRAGEGNYCYKAIPFHDVPNVYRLAFVERGSDGYWPISEDLFIGTKLEMEAEADVLNLRRLDISPRGAALLVATSMANARR